MDYFMNVLLVSKNQYPYQHSLNKSIMNGLMFCAVLILSRMNVIHK